MSEGRASQHQQKDKTLLTLLYLCLILAIYSLVSRRCYLSVRHESVRERNARVEIVRNLVDLGASPFVKLTFPSDGNSQQPRKIVYVTRNSAGEFEYDLTNPDERPAFEQESHDVESPPPPTHCCTSEGDCFDSI